MQEVWKDIQGYEGLYQVSNQGRVRSLDHYASNGHADVLHKGRILKQDTSNCGYFRVLLSNGKTKKKVAVHRLVAENFINNPNNLPFVNHKDENKQNNCVDNLEWCTRSYNVNYGTAIKRKKEKISKKILQYDLEGKLVNEFDSILDVYVYLNKNKNSMITDCCKGRYKQAYGYVWKYKEAE